MALVAQLVAQAHPACAASSSEILAQVGERLVALLPLVPLSTLGAWAGVSMSCSRWAEGRSGKPQQFAGGTPGDSQAQQNYGIAAQSVFIPATLVT